MTLMDLTADDRVVARREMIAHGAVLAAAGECGTDGLPCGMCNECLSVMAECAICRGSEPSRVWPSVGTVGEHRACAECCEHVSAGSDR